MATTDHELIDHIVTLASLASVGHDIDPMLDDLRAVTSSWDGRQPLGAGDRATLVTLESNLRTYLTHDDPLRTFTEKSLDHHLEAQAGQRVWGIRRSIIAIILPPVLAITIALNAREQSLTFFDRLLLAVPLTLVGLAFTTAWLYLSSLSTFRSQVRRVFIWFSLSTIFMAMVFAHLIANQILEPLKYDIYLRWHNVVLAMIGFASLYAGLRLYARALSIKTRYSSLAVFGLASVGLAGVFCLATLTRAPLTAQGYVDLALVAPMLVSLFFSAVLASRIKAIVTKTYARTMQLLGWYARIIFAAAFVAIIIFLATGKLAIMGFNALVIATGIMPQLMLLYSGYTFKRDANMQTQGTAPTPD